MASKLDAYLTDPNAAFVVWDLNIDDGEATLAACKLVDDHVHIMAAEAYPEAEQDAVSTAWRERGFRVGGFDSQGPPVVWVPDGDAVTVYNNEETLLRVDKDTLYYTYNRTLALADIEGFVAYVDDGYINRGVRAKLVGTDKLKSVLFQLSGAAASDPTYGRNEMLGDSEWCWAIAQELAAVTGKSAVNTILD
ncbi:MAG: hypothetical protein ACI9MR_003635 [Myxococcota bacterium]|jgi:hypothetical protein